MKNNIISHLRDALLISFPVLVVFLVVPVQIYLSNQVEFQYEHEIVFVFFMIFLIYFLTAFILVRIIPEKWRRVISSTSFFIGLYLNFSVLFIPVQLRELIGKSELDAIAEPPLLSAFEILIGLGVIFLAIKIPWEKFRNIGSIYSLLTLFGITGFFYTQIQFPDRKTTPPSELVSQNKSNGCNVYHFIFDAFDSILFEKLIDNLHIRERFNGFTFYQNNICNYTTTSLSVPSLMTGKFLDGEIKVKDFHSLSEGIIKSLKDVGYRISQYDMYTSPHEATDYWMSPHLIEKELNQKTNVLKLADLSILVAAPNFLQNECFKSGKGVASRLILLITTLPNWNDRNPVVSLSMIQKLIADESSRSSKGEYVYAHFMIPHPPYVFDENCNFIGKQSNNIQTKKGKVNLVKQNYCAGKQMVNILEHLKKEQKFESSLIIIQADHGEIKRTHSLLLVKKPGSSNSPLKTSKYFTHLLDVAPTILDAAGLESDHLNGRSLLSSELSDRRDLPMGIGLSKSKEFLHYTWRDGVVIKKNPSIIRTDIN